MTFKIGDAQIKQMRRTHEDGPEEVLTTSFDAEGREVDVTFHIRRPSGEEVTLHGEEAMVLRPDGSVRFFKAIGALQFEFCEGLRSLPGGGSEGESPSAEEVDYDLSLIASAKILFAKAQESPDGFKEVDELF
jgi:hypothetical protein